MRKKIKIIVLAVDLTGGFYLRRVKPGAIFEVYEKSYIDNTRYDFVEESGNAWILKEHCKVLHSKNIIGGEIL